jgi:hypothetical protein
MPRAALRHLKLLMPVVCLACGSCAKESGPSLAVRPVAFQASGAKSPYRVTFTEHYDQATGRQIVVQTIYWQPPDRGEVTIEKTERVYERGRLTSEEQFLFDRDSGEMLSQVNRAFHHGRLLRDDRVTYRDGLADQWFLQVYYDSGRRQRMQYGNYYHPFVSLQARDIELYRDDTRNTKSHSEVRDYFPNPEIANQDHEKFNIEMCRHKREWEFREDGSPFNFQFNTYGNQLLRQGGKLEHEHIRQINIDYTPEGTIPPDGYRERKY